MGALLYQEYVLLPILYIGLYFLNDVEALFVNIFV